MQLLHFEHEKLHALRIEGRDWMNDISLPQAWAVLWAAYQELEEDAELMFMVQLPSGDQPALCLTRQIFETLVPNPGALARRLARRVWDQGLDEPGEDDTPACLATVSAQLHRLRPF